MLKFLLLLPVKLLIKLLKFLLRFGLKLLLLLVVLLFVAVLYFGGTEVGQKQLAKLISDVVSNETQTLELAPIEGLLSGDIQIDHVKMSEISGDESRTWLDVEDIRLDWQPSKLLGLGLLIEEFRVASIYVDSPPPSTTPKETETSTSFAVPQLPIDIRIDRWALDSIELTEGLVGQSVKLSNQGSFIYPRDASQLRLETSVERLDATPGKLNAVIAFEPEQQRLIADVTASEPEGGLIAQALQWPTDTTTIVALSGAGNLQQWDGDLVLLADDEALVDLQIHQQQLSDKSHEVRINGPLQIVDIAAAFLPDTVNLEELLAGSTALDVDVQLSPALLGQDNDSDSMNGEQSASAQTQADILIRTATVTNQQWQLALQPSNIYLEETGPVADLSTLSLTAIDGPLKIIAAGQEIDFSQLQATANLAQQALNATLSVDIPKVISNDIQIENIRLNADADLTDYTKPSGQVEYALLVDQLDLPQPNLPPITEKPIALTGQVDLSEELIKFVDTNLAIDQNLVNLSGQFNPTTLSAQGNVSSTLTTADLAASNVVTLVGQQLTLSTDFKADLSPTLSVSANNLAFNAAGIDVDANAALVGEQLSASLTATLARLQQFSPQLAGALTAQLDASGSFDDLKADLQVTSDQLRANGESINNLNATVAAKLVNNQPSATVNVTANYQNAPLLLQTQITPDSDSGAINVSDLLAQIGGNQISGEIEYANGVPTGNIDLDLPDLSSLGALANVDLSGEVAGNIRLDNDDSPRINASLQADNIATDAANFDRVNVNATVTNYLTNPDIDAQVIASDINAGGQSIRRAEVTALGDLSDLALDAEANYNGEVSSVSGNYLASGDSQRFRLNDVNLNYQGFPVRLNQPATIQLTPELDIPPLSLSAAGGRIDISGSAPDPLDMQIDISGIDVAQFEPFLPPGTLLNGGVNGQISISGSAENPRINYDIQLNDFVADALAAQGIAPINTTLSGNFANNQVQLDNLNIANAQSLGMDVSGGVNLQNQTLDFSLNGLIPVGIAEVILAENNLSAEGALRVNMRITGPFSAPQLNGSITDESLAVTDNTSGMSLSPIDINILMNGQQVQIQTLRANIDAGGSIAISGNIGIDPASQIPLDIDIRMNNAHLTDGNIVETIVGGNVTIDGQALGALNVGGTINIGETNITVPDALPGNIAQLDVTHINESLAVQEQLIRLFGENMQASDGAATTRPINLALTINAPNQIFIRGRGLDIEMGGRLRITGTAANPRTVGGLELQRGRLNFLEKRINFTEGEISFAGSLVPQLNFIATRQAEDVLISIEVTGDADDPEINFSSSPELPQDELIAKLLFERSIDELSPFQLVQLANATAKLTGISKGPTLTEQLRGSIGVDDIDIVQDPTTGETSVEVGKYINEDTYLTVQQGPSPEKNRATIDIDIGRNFRFQGEATQEGEGKIGIFFEREY